MFCLLVTSNNTHITAHELAWNTYTVLLIKWTNEILWCYVRTGTWPFVFSIQYLNDYLSVFFYKLTILRSHFPELPIKKSFFFFLFPCKVTSLLYVINLPLMTLSVLLSPYSVCHSREFSLHGKVTVPLKILSCFGCWNLLQSNSKYWIWKTFSGCFISVHELIF